MPEYSDQELKDLEEITNIADIQNKINIAREWALDHFNAKEAGNPSLIDPGTLEFTKPSSFIEFPEPDEMIVIPSILGKRVLYIIIFNYGSMRMELLNGGQIIQFSEFQCLP